MPRSYGNFGVALVATLLAISLLITFSTIPNSTTSVSVLAEANGVGVYWDSSCTDPVSFIDWETLTPGSAKSYPVYIRNEGEEPMYLRKLVENWSSQDARQYLDLDWDYKSWDYKEKRINSGENLSITLTLSVSSDIKGISEFSFDILIYGRDRLLGDVNGDGIVTARDMILVGYALFSSPEDLNYNSYADVNDDGKIGAADILILGEELF